MASLTLGAGWIVRLIGLSIESKILKLKNNKYVINGVWYVLRLYWYNEPYVNNETLYLKDEELQMTGETLVIL